MKLQTKLSFVTAAALLAAVGCTTLPNQMITPTPSPSATTYQLSGRITFKSGDPGQALTLKLKKYDGAAWQKLDTPVITTNASGSYGVNSLAAGKYQVYYDDQGTTVTDPTVNTTGVYVSPAFDLTASSNTTVSFDVAWPFSPSIAPYATYAIGSSSFGWAANTNTPGAEYQVLVADSASASVWSSTFATATSASWDGVRTATGTGATSAVGQQVPSGKYYYLIKFQKPGTTFGGEGYYGQTKWVPFNI